MKIVCKVYEKDRKLRIKNKQENISSMQTRGKENMSTMDSRIIINAIIQQQRQDHRHTIVYRCRIIPWQILL